MSSAKKGGLVGALIEASVRNRFFVLLLALLASVGGVWALSTTPVDAIPDLSDVQVIVYTGVLVLAWVGISMGLAWVGTKILGAEARHPV